MKIQKTLGTALAAGLMLWGSSTSLRAQRYEHMDNQRGQLSAKDYKFVTDAALGGQQEVQNGELARSRAGSQAVRDFGDRMVADHSRANDELKEIVMRKGATVPMELPRSERMSMNKLEKQSGVDFDREYTRMMLKDHKKDVKEFQRAARSLDDPDLRAFAQRTLPTLEQHLRMAENMGATVKNER